MMASRAAGFFVLLNLSIVLLSFRCNEVMAWQSSSSSRRMVKTTSSSITDIGTDVTTDQHQPNMFDGPEILPFSRRRLLFQISKMTAIVATTTTVLLPHRAAAAPVMTADSARAQWRQAVQELDDLLQNWLADRWAVEVGGGDAIRTKLGTQGAASPLYQIEKVFKGLRDSEYVEDAIEFQETAEEFMNALYMADSLASSSNNKTGSGKQTPPEVFIEQSRVEVVKLQSIAKKLNAMVK